MTDRALLIGVSQYEHEHLTALLGPKTDVAKLAEILSDQRRSDFAVQAIVDPNTKEATRAIVALLKGARAGDTVLLYFSGHGKLDLEGDFYLCFRDTEPDLLSATSYPWYLFKREIEQSAAGKILLVLDCCHSGAAKNDLRPDVSAKVHYRLASCLASQRSKDAEREGEMSRYTGILVEALTDPTCDYEGKGHITVENVRDFIRNRYGTSTQPDFWAAGIAGLRLVRVLPREGHAATHETADPENPNESGAIVTKDKPHVADGTISKVNPQIAETSASELTLSSALALSVGFAALIGGLFAWAVGSLQPNLFRHKILLGLEHGLPRPWETRPVFIALALGASVVQAYVLAFVAERKHVIGPGPDWLTRAAVSFVLCGVLYGWYHRDVNIDADLVLLSAFSTLVCVPAACAIRAAWFYGGGLFSKSRRISSRVRLAVRIGLVGSAAILVNSVCRPSEDARRWGLEEEVLNGRRAALLVLLVYAVAIILLYAVARVRSVAVTTRSRALASCISLIAAGCIAIVALHPRSYAEADHVPPSVGTDQGPLDASVVDARDATVTATPLAPPGASRTVTVDASSSGASTMQDAGVRQLRRTDRHAERRDAGVLADATPAESSQNLDDSRYLVTKRITCRPNDQRCQLSKDALSVVQSEFGACEDLLTPGNVVDIFNDASIGLLLDDRQYVSNGMTRQETVTALRKCLQPSLDAIPKTAPRECRCALRIVVANRPLK